MAEVMAYTLLKVILQKLADQAVKQVVRVHGTRSELKSLEKTLFNIQALLVNAADKEIKEVLIQKWLNDLQHLVYDIDDILDDLAINAMHPEFAKDSRASTSKVRKLITSCYKNFSLSTRTHHMLNDINIKLQDLEKEKETLGLTVKNGRLEVNDVRSKDNNRKLGISLVDASGIVGRQGEKDAFIHKLLGDDPCSKNYSIVPIVGMGGVGKTTLARLLYNEKQVNDQFELKAWVCVSDGWDSFAISNIIFQSVTGENKEFADLNLLQVALRGKLSAKRFILVIDDLWTENHEDWETLVRPLSACAPRSKIIITTRKEQLLRELGCRQLNQLECLLHDDAVCLFSQHALGENNFGLHPTLAAHGEDIVKKCKGLPLALIALGRLLRRKEDEVEWKEIVESEIWSLKEGGKIIPALRLSYHELPAHLKQLFAYCSLFPKGYSYNPEDLVLLWMAEGFLHKSTPSKSTEERLGHEYFQELLSRSFFQHAPNDEALFVMHDLMNDLATYVAGDFFFRLDKEIGKEVRIQALEKLRHMSFVNDEYETYEKFKVFKGATSLRTFLGVFSGVKEQWQEFNLSNKIPGDLLPKLPVLRVLCLSGYTITEVPDSIGSLKHLRYINLSRTRITHLPESVCELYGLQTLIVFGCSSLTNLPKSFLKLKNLQHFDIRYTSLWNDIPLGISELKSLKILSEIIIGTENDISITQLKDLRNLRERISFKVLKNAILAPEANLSQKRLTDLEVEWSYVSDGSRKEITEKEVLDSLRPHNDGLKKLRIVNYFGLEFPKWVGDPLFSRLARVSIHGCKKCTSLPPLGQLPSLKELSIQDVGDVKFVGSEFVGTGVAFPSLEILKFKGMPGWEVWSTNSGSGVGDSVFPCLKELYMEGCPNLVKVSIEALPSLKVLKIKEGGNGVLRSLVYVAPSVTKLEIKSISGLTNEVWRGVILDLKAVEELTVKECDEIRYLWESKDADACSKVLVNLRKLEVGHCYDLVSLGEKDKEYSYGSNILTSVRTLEVNGCRKLEHIRCPDNIERLGIYSCDSITCVSFSPGGGQKLKSFSIALCCYRLLFKELGQGGEENSLVINSISMPMLEDVFIYKYQNVSSIIKFGNFVHLTRLKIQKCRTNDLQLQILTSLTCLQITSCPSMDVPGVWPPQLRKLTIGKLKKPISEWGQQINFPASLVDLSLIGAYEKEEASSISEFSHLLPSSLTSLEIWHFKKLERVSKGLQHLISLQHFSIRYCPGTKDLPEKLLPSLLSLVISKCPSLEESCSTRGAYWPLISHIPRIVKDID